MWRDEDSAEWEIDPMCAYLGCISICLRAVKKNFLVADDRDIAPGRIGFKNDVFMELLILLPMSWMVYVWSGMILRDMLSKEVGF